MKICLSENSPMSLREQETKMWDMCVLIEKIGLVPGQRKEALQLRLG